MYAAPTNNPYGQYGNTMNSQYSHAPQPSQYMYSHADSSTTLHSAAPKSEYSYPATSTTGYRGPSLEYANGGTYHGAPSSLLKKDSPPYSSLHDKDDDKVGGIRYCCGCFAKRSTCIGWCSLIWIIILAGVGVALYFLFPRQPKIDISTPYIPQSAAGFKIPASGPGSAWRPGPNFDGKIGEASKANPFSLQIGLGVNITVDSPNFVGFDVKSLEITGFLKDVDGKIIRPSNDNKVDATSKVNDINIKAKGITTILLPVAVNYTLYQPISVPQLGTDPVIAVLAKACGIPGIRQKDPSAKLSMKVKAVISLKIIAWTGINPEVEKDVSFDCPDIVSSSLANIFGGAVGAAVDAATNAVTGGNGAGNTPSRRDEDVT